MATSRFGPFAVVNGLVGTNVVINAGDEVRTVSSGTVDFGGGVFGVGAPSFTADGEDAPTPAGYPAPALRKNSLVCLVAGAAFQGGTDQTFVPTVGGPLTLSLNDPSPGDNARGWTVLVEVTNPEPGQRTRPRGTFTVATGTVTTGIMVTPNDIVRTVSTGTVDFGGAVLGIGAPSFTADGEDAPTPRDYPAPELRKNSLICSIDGRLHQGGVDRTVHPTSSGILLLFPNDPTPADNLRSWQVTVLVTTAAPSTDPVSVHGPFQVTGPAVSTSLTVDAGDEIRTVATGWVNFGGGTVFGIGAPSFTADGEDAPTPSDYPAPQLRKNSLICRVGSRVHQGGIDRTFRATERGEVVLLPNDRTFEDNSDAWSVTLEHRSSGLVSPPPTTEPLRVTAMEVVQAIQRSNSSVRLVAGKRTLVRVFVDPGAAAQPNVTGELTAFDAATGAVRGTATGVGDSMSARPAAAQLRDLLTDSLNFELPPGALNGTVRLDVRVWAPGRTRQGVGSRVAVFETRPRQPIQPILLSDPRLGLLAPTMAEFVSTLESGRKRWPIAEDGFVVSPTPITGTITENLNQRGAWGALLGRIAGMALMGGPALRVGLVPNGVDYNLNGVGRGPSVIGPPGYVCQQFFGATFVHEFAHACGVGHASCPPPGAPRAPDGLDNRLPVTIEDFGLDLTPVPTLIPRTRNELMTYCGDQARWPSIALWNILLTAPAPLL